MKPMLQQPGNYEKAQDGKSCQGHAEETERVEVLFVPERIGQKNREWAQSAEHWAVKVEACAIGGRHGEVSQQGAVVEVHHGEEAVVQAQAQQELQTWPGPRHPEGQERETEERAIGGESLKALQHHLWICDLSTCPGWENKKINSN